jgi:hypothetical protein
VPTSTTTFSNAQAQQTSTSSATYVPSTTIVSSPSFSATATESATASTTVSSSLSVTSTPTVTPTITVTSTPVTTATISTTVTTTIIPTTKTTPSVSPTLVSTPIATPSNTSTPAPQGVCVLCGMPKIGDDTSNLDLDDLGGYSCQELTEEMKKTGKHVRPDGRVCEVKGTSCTVGESIENVCSYYACAVEGEEDAGQCVQFEGPAPAGQKTCSGSGPEGDERECGYTMCEGNACKLVSNPVDDVKDQQQSQCSTMDVGKAESQDCIKQCYTEDDGSFACRLGKSFEREEGESSVICNSSAECKKICKETYDSGKRTGKYVCEFTQAIDLNPVSGPEKTCKLAEDCLGIRKVCQVTPAANFKSGKMYCGYTRQGTGKDECGEDSNCTKQCYRQLMIDNNVSWYNYVCSTPSEAGRLQAIGVACSTNDNCRDAATTNSIGRPADNGGLNVPPNISVSSGSRSSINFSEYSSVNLKEELKNLNPTTIYLYQDLKCGMCKFSYEQAVKQILSDEELSKKLKIVFKEFPLGRREEESKLAIAAKCSAKQNKYNEFINYIYSNSKNSTSKNLPQIAEEIALNQDSFLSCLNDKSVEAEMLADYNDGIKLGINGTPSYVINNKVYAGARNLQELINIAKNNSEIN